MKRTARRLILLALSTLLGCSSGTVPPAPVSLPVLRVDSSPDTVAVLNHARAQLQLESPDAVFQSEQHSHALMQDALNNDTPFFFLSYQAVNDANIASIPVLQDGLAIITHPENAIDNISPDTVRRIYQGFITNWDEISGNSQPIIVFSQEAGSDTRMAFEQLVMGRRALSSDIRVVPNSMEAMRLVAETPGAIAYVPASLVNDDIKILAVDGVLPAVAQISAQRYPLRMTIFLNGNRPAEGEMQRFIQLLQQPERYLPAPPRYSPLVE